MVGSANIWNTIGADVNNSLSEQVIGICCCCCCYLFLCVWVWIHECRYPQRPEASHSSGVWVPSSCRKLMWVLQLNWGPLREQHATHLTTGQLCRPKWSLFWGLAHLMGFPFLSFASLRLQLGCQRKGTEVDVAIWKGPATQPQPVTVLVPGPCQSKRSCKTFPNV